MIRPRTLRGLGIAFLLLFVAAVTGVGIAIYAATHQVLDQQVDRRLADEAAQIVAGKDMPTLATMIERIELREDRRESRDVGYMLVDRSGHYVAGSVVMKLPPPGFSRVDRDDRIPGLSRGRALVVPAGPGHMLALIAESEPIDHFDSLFIQVLLFGLGSLAILVALGVVALTWTIRKRIADMREAVEAIMDGDMDRRIRMGGTRSEFDQQAQLLNRMLDRIQQLIGAIRHVAHDAAHDLRTPLSRLRNSLTLLARKAEGDRLESDIADALAQSEDTLALLSAILRIAEIEGGDRRARFERIDLSSLIEDLTTGYQPAIEDGGWSLEREIAPGLEIDGDRQLLNQALGNLLENCLAHTKPGTIISISASREGSNVRVDVADDGSGITPADRDIAMRRFGRLTIDSTGGGHGLGLPLVAAIAELHRGKILLGDANPGLLVTLFFPMASIPIRPTAG